MKSEFLTFGVQSGSALASETTKPYFMSLRRALAAHSRKDYSIVIKEFGFVLRIDGALSNWHKTGCDYLRVTPKHGYATVDIFMPEETWQDGDRIRISGYLDKYTRTGFQMMLERVLRKNITIDSEALSKDFEASMLEFEQTI